MRFHFTGFDKNGRPVCDQIEANSAAEATETLRERGVFVSEITAAQQNTAARSSGSLLGHSARLRNLVAMSRQMSVLVSTGTPVVEALASIERQTSDEDFRAILTDLRKRVEEGAMLSEAMTAYPAHFDGVTRSLVAAGETGGRLDAMLDRLARIARQQQKIEGSVKGAMVYPILLTCIALAVMGLMVGFVLPRFEGLFKTLGAPLPPSTRVLMDLSAFVRDHWMIVIAAVVGVLVGGVSWIRSATGRAMVHHLSVSLPTVGPLTRAFVTARILRILGVLLEAKVSLLDALRMVRESTSNGLYASLILEAEEAVTRGESVSAALSHKKAGVPLFASSVCEAIRSGEKAGRVGAVLLSVADAMDEDNEVVLKSLTSIIEPVILLVLGIVVGGVAISMFLPLFDLTAASQASAGGGAP